MEWFSEGTVTTPAGFQAGTAACGIKKSGDLDIALVYSDRECAVAAVFTQNQVVAAPVIIDRTSLKQNGHRVRAVVANSGNANACTGQPGLENARGTQQITADLLNIRSDEVLLLSTGVIGVQLPMAKVAQGVQEAVGNLSVEGGPYAAQAIMTTDTYAKHAAVRVDLSGGPVMIGGMAKGVGMVHPNMATVLGLFTTDADIPSELLTSMLKSAVNKSFNRVTVDGDTSTNDTVLLLANGASGLGIRDEESAAVFQEGLDAICSGLAKMLVRDGEGATKFVEISVTGAPDDRAARAVVSTIATSPLVKTAFAGSDANWGRILAAAGRAGVPFDQDRTRLWVGINRANELQLVAEGTPTNYLEADAAAIFAEPAFKILLDLNAGRGSATMWTSDLSHGYVTINADYRT